MYFELRHLRTIKAIHDTGGLARAADMMNMTQSALSHQVKGLEEQAGVELFVRRSKPLKLSAAGQRMLKVAERVLPMQNRAASEVFYQFDSREQFQVDRRLDEDGQECCVIYHSHTASQAFPSKDDIDFAGHPELHYLIVSTWDQATVPVRSFRIIDGGVTEETIVIV